MSGSSLRKIKKKRGPRMEPCGSKNDIVGNITDRRSDKKNVTFEDIGTAMMKLKKAGGLEILYHIFESG